MAPTPATLDFIDFVNSSPTRTSQFAHTVSSICNANVQPKAYHAVRSAISRLEKAGFVNIKERDSWASSLQPGGKYYLTRNASSIVAFAIGSKWKPGNSIAMIGAHTDSPCLRIKPVSKKSNVGFMQVGVETYGGGIWHTWFDRDLSIAGRVLCKDGDGNFEQKLIKVDKPILRIPTLAIHLDRSTEFKPNKETELFPIAGLVAAELNRVGKKTSQVEPLEDKDANYKPLKQMDERHHPYVLDVIAEHAGVDVSNVIDFEIVLYDTQPSCIGGIHDEFIFSPRLDNLNMTYCSIMGLIESVEKNPLAVESSIRLVTCFDHEEIGSTSAHGAQSNLLPAVIRRLSMLPASKYPGSDSDDYENVMTDSDLATAYEQTLITSFLVSADMAHSVHPNYAGKYESSHQPEMNKGVVIKVNANQRYATNSPGIVIVQEAARLAGVPLQLFVVRNDSPCGSTIGPALSASMGVRTLDLGNPQLSMHSIRETGGSHDVDHAIKLFDSFLSNYAKLEAKITID
ncbi:uncharacterized protein MKZ38_010774 [Zalerion maritima]|uniref:aspartyl aminopeptidase n=1 Tax=Zalerion maritima TaxID=339359 RepID=A0AAD5S053_9PEZI|nr:uncharacterized protein MKZ38_010774 [Zalerion maritima]